MVLYGARDSGYGWKETHSTAISASDGEVVYLCSDGKSGTRLVGEDMERPYACGCAYDKSKGTR